MKRSSRMLSFESEGLSGPACDKRERRAPQLEKDSAPADSTSTKATLETSGRKSKRKFAWMDSEDESNADESDGSDSEEKARSHDSPRVVLPDSVRNVETFAEFLRITPALKPTVPSMPVGELIALCETASRLKYFDGDLFADVFKQISARIRAGEFDISSITVVATALVDLNACDVSVFSAAADVLIRRIGELSKDQRLHWVKLLASSGHPADQVVRHTALVRALKAPPPEDEAPQVRVCYEWVGQGFCPRGTTCMFAHPKKQANNTLSRSCTTQSFR